MFRADELKNFQLDNKNIYSNNTSGDGENFVNDESVEEPSDDGEEFRAIDSHQPSDSWSHEKYKLFLLLSSSSVTLWSSSYSSEHHPLSLKRWTDKNRFL